MKAMTINAGTTMNAVIIPQPIPNPTLKLLGGCGAGGCGRGVGGSFHSTAGGGIGGVARMPSNRAHSNEVPHREQAAFVAVCLSANRCDSPHDGQSKSIMALVR